jgi:maltooligosyltrehalose synthase
MKVYNPVSTYRIQFHKDFNFTDFEKIIPYLHNLGIKTIYASPVMEASPGSMHGYNGVNPNNINPEIGTLDQLFNISSQLKKLGIGWIQDIVPNHMSFDKEHNPWLRDVLEKGKYSEYASFFDIDWDHQWLDKQNRMNYRRFFTVDGLISLNIQNDKVFQEYHKLTKELCDKNIFDGLRIDHIDGLYDPKKYLKDLRKLAGEDKYIVVEKILEPEENLPEDWPIQGSSGYDYLGMVNNLFTNQSAEYDLTTFYYDITQNSTPVEEQIKEKKALILFNDMEAELDNLVRLYKSLEINPVDDKQLRKSIADYLIDCPVYRYYDDDYAIMKIDEGKNRATLKPFYTRCMQYAGPLMAKGVEDTLMYTYNRFIGHNEVGDMPTTFGYSPAKFHELMQYRRQHWPLSINGTSTHDTKRGEDARARLNAMTDLHEEWITSVKQWMKENEILKSNGMPDKNDEYFIYQTIMATWCEEQDYPDRIKEYLHKAFREAKTNTGWGDPNEEYENAAINFAQQVIAKKQFEGFLDKVIGIGNKKSLGQLVLKFTCPGIPDTYQGTELWDLSLVDPDNRRPVDYTLRNKQPDHIKFNLLKKLLVVRNKYADILTEGEYISLQTEGKYKDHLIAFARKLNDKSILVVTQINHTNSEWEDTKIILPPDLSIKWEDVFSPFEKGGSFAEGKTGDLYISNQKFLPGSLPAVYRSF